MSWRLHFSESPFSLHVPGYNLPTQETHTIFGRYRKARGHCSVSSIIGRILCADMGFSASLWWEAGKHSFCYLQDEERGSGNLGIFFKLKKLSCGLLQTTHFQPNIWLWSYNSFTDKLWLSVLFESKAREDSSTVPDCLARLCASWAAWSSRENGDCWNKGSVVGNDSIGRLWQVHKRFSYHWFVGSGVSRLPTCWVLHCMDSQYSVYIRITAKIYYRNPARICHWTIREEGTFRWSLEKSMHRCPSHTPWQAHKEPDLFYFFLSSNMYQYMCDIFPCWGSVPWVLLKAGHGDTFHQNSRLLQEIKYSHCLQKLFWKSWVTLSWDHKVVGREQCMKDEWVENSWTLVLYFL